MQTYTVTGDAARIRTHYAPEQIAALYTGGQNMDGVTHVHVVCHYPRDFGPSLHLFYADGRVRWLTFPGGMPHSAFYADDERPELPVVQS